MRDSSSQVDVISQRKHIPTLFIDVMNTVLVPRRGRIDLYQHLLAEQGIQASVSSIKEAYTLFRKMFESDIYTTGQGQISESERQKWTKINSAIVQNLHPVEQEKADYIGEWLFEQLMGNEAHYFIPDSMQQFLDNVHKFGFKIVAATNHNIGHLQLLLEKFALVNSFDMTIISDEIGFAKPDPRFYQAALDMADANPERSVFMGNNPLNDINGALRAGIKVCILLDYNGELSDGEGYTRVINPLDALPLLKRLVDVV